MDDIEITPTCRTHATCTDILLRDRENVRLIFKPALVTNKSNRDASVKGKFIYQKKGKDGWQDSECTSLKTIKAGEEYQLALSSDEVYLLRRSLHELAIAFQETGIPHQKATIVRPHRRLREVLAELNDFMETTEDASLVLKRILRWLRSSTRASELIADAPELALMNSLLALTRLRELRELWRLNQENCVEEFWQKTFASFHLLLSQLFDFPVSVIAEKAYVGGKVLSNKHGLLVDYLAKKDATGGAVIIEIKTPGTMLLGAKYRQTYSLSAELSGSISQVLLYRDTLVSEWRSVTAGHQDLRLCDPACLVIAGHSNKLTEPPMQEAFERFRGRLSGVTILTFDEVFARVDRLIQLLEIGK